MRLASARKLTAASLALTLPSLAMAHPGLGHGFMQGVSHPLGGLDHLLAMVAVGLLAGRAGGKALWQIPLSFMALMACGTLLGLAALPLPFTEIGIGLSIVAFGLMLTSQRTPSLMRTMFIVGFFALFHGHAHGTDAVADISGWSYVVGLLAASAVLHAGGAAIATLLLQTNATLGASMLRTSGGVLALAGLGFGLV